MTPPIVRLRSGAPVFARVEKRGLAERLGALPARACDGRPCIGVVTPSGILYWPLAGDVERMS